MKTCISQMVWPEVKEAVEREAVVMLPLASIEPSGLHAMMGGEAFIAEHFVKEVAQKTNDLHLPSMPFGYAPTFSEFPGAVTLQNDTLVNVIVDVCTSMIHNGFKHIMVVNNHSGNEAALEQAARIIRRKYGLVIGSILLPAIMRTMAEDLYDNFKELHGHGGEPGISIRQFLRPDDMRMDLAAEERITPYHGFKTKGNKIPVNNCSFTFYLDFSQTNPDGGSGYSLSPDPEKGRIILERMVDWGIEALNTFKKIPVYSPLKNS